MAVKIQTQKASIPVEIGDLEFGFSVTDESIDNFRKNAKAVQEELKGIDYESLSDDEAIAQSKEALKKGFDMFLGEGAFEKIYEQTPSVIMLMDYFVAVSEGIDVELNKIMNKGNIQDKAKRYLQEKNK